MAIEKTHWFLEYLVVVQKIIAIFARDNKKIQRGYLSGKF